MNVIVSDIPKNPRLVCDKNTDLSCCTLNNSKSLEGFLYENVAQ